MNTRTTQRMYARTTEVSVEKYTKSIACTETDLLAIEAPLEVQIIHYEQGIWRSNVLYITLRTPGEDTAMALGFLFAEGVIATVDDIKSVEEVAPVSRDKPFAASLAVELQPHVVFDPTALDRHFFSTSSCGACGRLTLDNLPAQTKRSPFFQLRPSLMYQLQNHINRYQTLFQHTGGIHAAALFDKTGQFLHLSEDVGRHNAMDKLTGAMLLQHNAPPFSEHIVLFSGRVSYELIQKAVVAGIPVIAAIGAPSSLAVEIAQTYGITLIGFLRDNRFNVYSGKERIEGVG